VIDETKIEELRAQHGEVHILTADDQHTIVVRCPTAPEFERFEAHFADEKKAARALGQLVRDVVVWPSRDEYDEMLARRPGLRLAYAKDVLRIAGATVEVEAKKH
jgi:hypothetical protein